MGDYVTKESTCLDTIRRGKTGQDKIFNHKKGASMKKSIAEISIDSHAIYKRLIKLNPGEMIGYNELSSVIGRDFQKYGRGNYETACKIALRDDKMVFVSVRDEGIKRLENEAIPGTIGTGSISKIRRLSKRSAKKIMATDYENLTNAGKISHGMGLSVLGAFLQMTKPKSIAIIEDAVKIDDLNKLTFAKTLDQFKKS